MSKLNLLSVPVGPDLPAQPVLLKGETLEIVFSYDVAWEYSPIKWASRWDLYLYMGDDQIHWRARDAAPRTPRPHARDAGSDRESHPLAHATCHR
eukprot:3500686-Pleurochrysis_carterae.AAC.1